MALSTTGLGAAMKPIRTPGLFDPKAAGMSFEQWKTNTPSDAKMPSIAPAQVDDSVANKVASLTSQDSVLMQAAKTEGLKAANRRGLLNSSMAAGAAMDAMTRYAMPIASQDASQDFNRNSAARQFEYGMAAQGDAQNFQSGQSALDRQLQERMQNRDIGFRMNLFDRDAGLQRELQGNQIRQETSQRALDRGLQEKIASWNMDDSERNATAQFLSNVENIYAGQYQAILSNPNLDAASRSQFMASIKNLRDTQINFVEQVFQVDLRW